MSEHCLVVDNSSQRSRGAGRQTTLQFGACTSAQNNPPCASSSRQPYIGQVDSEVQQLFRSPSTATWSPIVLYSESSLENSLWDGQDQPPTYIGPPKPFRNVPTTNISSLPHPTMVVLALCIPPWELPPTPIPQNPPSQASPCAGASRLPQLVNVPISSLNLPCRPVPCREDIKGHIFDPAVNGPIGPPPTDKDMAKI